MLFIAFYLLDKNYNIVYNISRNKGKGGNINEYANRRNAGKLRPAGRG